MAESLKDKACIVGIGETEYSKSSGRSEMRLALEVISSACDDAGISPKEIDGIVRFSVDSNQIDEVARNLGLENVRFFPEVFFGGGAGCGIVQMAAMAVALGKAKYVACFRALNERSGFRYGQMGGVMPMQGHFQYSIPFGLIAPGAMVAVMARRHMHLYGTRTTDLGEVAVAFRKHANMNPKAMMHERTLTLEDHANARMISDPLRLFDFCQESDGAVALIVTSAERAKDLKQKPVYIMAAEQGTGSWMEMMTSYQREDIADLEEYTRLAPHLWREAGIGPQDIDCAQLYDAFTPLIVMQLESFGFCKPGEGGPFVRDGALQIGGRLPTNTSGGCLSEAYIHGLNQLSEAVRQIRGTSLVQVPNCRHVLVTAGSGIPTGALVLH
jgi:acetyl-CoA acetyltransferase